MSIQSTESPLSVLNTGQAEAYQAIKEGKSIFLTGPGGTGKSFLLKHVYDTISGSISLTALTGCAALLLHSKAKTLHSWAGIGLGTDVVPLLISKLKNKNSRRAAKRWLETDILVIDEISMMTPDLFEKLEEIARKIRGNNRPFGGIQLVLVGDFFQLPPVVSGSQGSQSPLSPSPLATQPPIQETNFVFESPLWQKMGLQTCDLTEIVRQKDPVFQTLLNEARRGEISKASLKILRKRMDLPYSSLAIQPTMLFTRRAQVDHINMIHLRKLTTEKKTFTATTAFLPIANTNGLHEKHPDVIHAVQSLDNAAPYPVELTLAVGAQVMLLTNMNPEAGLVNGSRGVVVGFQRPLNPDETIPLTQTKDTTFPLVQFKSGDRRVIEYHTWEIADLPGVIRKQIPLRLAYAITIHKAQGATLDCALIDVGGRTFEYGQAYVALSRVRDIDSLYIHDVEADAFRAHPKVKKFYS